MADVWIASQQLVDPPTDIDVSEDVVVTLRKVLHNDGPYGPVEVEIETTATPPQDCTVELTEPDVRQVVLPSSVDVVLDEEFIVHCDAPSSHVFYFENQITRVKNPGAVDPDLGNNFASTQLTVDVWALADLEMISQYVEYPPDGSTIPAGEDVEVMVLSVIRNDGPFTPVEALAETIVSWQDGCHLVDPPDGRHLERIRNLPVGVNVPLKAPFIIRCAESGQHTFKFDNTMDIDMQHVRDPDAGNNTGHTELTVTAS